MSPLYQSKMASKCANLSTEFEPVFDENLFQELTKLHRIEQLTD